MRTLCDVCESAAAILFCAADEAALCQSCDDKVHLCNKLASRHVRVKLADPTGVGHCDICENAPAFFYCEIDGSCLCLQCDMIVHVGGKRTHGRYLLFRQRVEFPIDKPGLFDDLIMQQNQTARMEKGENLQNHIISSVSAPVPNHSEPGKMESKMIDLNARPNQINGQTSNNQVQNLVMLNGYCEESASIPREPFEREPAK